MARNTQTDMIERWIRQAVEGRSSAREVASKILDWSRRVRNTAVTVDLDVFKVPGVMVGVTFRDGELMAIVRTKHGACEYPARYVSAVEG